MERFNEDAKIVLVQWRGHRSDNLGDDCPRLGPFLEKIDTLIIDSMDSKQLRVESICLEETFVCYSSCLVALSFIVLQFIAKDFEKF